MAKVFISHAREIFAGIMQPKGDSTTVKGIWVGKHDESDDHIYLTSSGSHRSRTVGRLEPIKRVVCKLIKEVKGAPWGNRATVPTGSGARAKSLPAPILP